jgi:hypothetical protein
MYHEACRAILPPTSLAETFRDWGDITENLAEPPRARSRHRFLTCMRQDCNLTATLRKDIIEMRGWSALIARSLSCF